VRAAVFKYPLALVAHQEIQVHPIRHLLSVHVQNGTVCLWAEVDPEGKEQSMPVYVVGTGWAMPELACGPLRFLGTVFLDEFVWHVFVGEAR